MDKRPYLDVLWRGRSGRIIDEKHVHCDHCSMYFVIYLLSSCSFNHFRETTISKICPSDKNQEKNGYEKIQ